MKTIIITIIICQLISLIGLIIWDKTGYKDEWLILCCPLFLIPLIIIRQINIFLFHRPTSKVIKSHRIREKYEIWTKYNIKTKIYETKINQENYNSWDHDILLYKGKNKKEAINKFNEYKNKTEKELEKIFKEEFKDEG